MNAPAANPLQEEGLGLVIDDRHQPTINSFAAVPVTFGATPADVPPRWVPPLIVESQGRTNSCAGHSEALACSHANYVATGEVIRFSRRFAYLTAQKEGGFSGRDGGTSILSTLLAATKYGCCREATCPFQEAYSTRIAQECYTEAANHRHHGETRYDCRDWDTAIAWLTDRRAIIIGTKWTSAQQGCNGIESLAVGSSGSFRGYHARTLIGWDTLDGMLVPVVQNSHGQQWADHGRAKITRDLWAWWLRDPNTFALGFNRIDEIEPVRRDWSESKPGDAC
jgi:hypothetical protein